MYLTHNTKRLVSKRDYTVKWLQGQQRKQWISLRDGGVSFHVLICHHIRSPRHVVESLHRYRKHPWSRGLPSAPLYYPHSDETTSLPAVPILQSVSTSLATLTATTTTAAPRFLPPSPAVSSSFPLSFHFILQTLLTSRSNFIFCKPARNDYDYLYYP